MLKLKLGNIVEYIKPSIVLNSQNRNNIDVTGISYNSKTVESGNIFVCLVGEHVDGHNFVAMAVERGASAIVAQKEISDIDIPVLVVEDTQLALAQISAMFYDFPTKKLNLIGVTGTNGKTTVTHLLENILELNSINCGLIGTLGQRLSSKDPYTDAKHTTPQAPELQKTFNTMLTRGTEYVVMEVSSHALEQHRVGESEFKGAILTNLTQDHLDYHITMENYFKAKNKLFISLEKSSKQGKYAVINKDDEFGERFMDSVPSGIRVLTYGVNNQADIMALNIEFTVNGSSFDCKTPVGDRKINLQITGLFSIYNALAALTAGIAEGFDLDICIKALESTKSVTGRFEVVTKEPLVIVDYAHTPDGLENVLKAAREIVPEGGKLICLFGCGGDRDATKRPRMGGIAENLSDMVVITSDNPRSEDPQQVITDILTGIKSLNSDRIMVETNRRAAIELAIKNADDNDIVIIAGKGHEDYQILKNETIHFDDREEARFAFEKIKGKKAV